MKRRRDIMDYNPIQIITDAHLVFMMIRLNSRITEFDPVRCWIDGVV